MTLLRTVYRINAAASLACGVVLIGLGDVLAAAFAVPSTPLRTAGVLFVPFAVWVWAASRRPQPLAPEALAIGLLDAVYAIASFIFAVDATQFSTALRAAVAVVGAPVALFAIVELSSSARLRGQAAAAGTGGALTARSTRL